MPWPVHPNGLLGAQGDNDNYQISRSLRFNSGDSAYLNRTNSGSPTNAIKYTASVWVKRGSTGSVQNIMGATNSGSDDTYFRFESNDTLLIGSYSGPGTDYNITSTPVFRDPSAWYHIVVVFDSANATSADRAILYVNGARQVVTSPSNGMWPQNSTLNKLNTASQLVNIGRRSTFNDVHLSAYLTEINFIDGQALTPSSFGETDAITGRWKAKAYSGTYGTNGFYLKFADNSSTAALGTDSSGNGNTWTTNNFSVTAGAGNDSLVDSPTNYGSDTGAGGTLRGNYCTLNPLDKGSSATLSDGNLVLSLSAASSVRGTIGVSSGKWYWETIWGGTSGLIGIAKGDTLLSSYVGRYSDQWAYAQTGEKYTGNVGVAYGATFTTGDIIGVALNVDSGQLTFYKNGASQGVAYSGLTSGPYFPAFGDNSATTNHVTNFGQRPFAYTAPTGFKALCTTNLTTPTIKKPSSYMDVVTYTGNGVTNSITGLGFSPDMVWLKGRSLAAHHRIYDTIRGVTKVMYPSLIDAEVTVPDANDNFVSFDSGGFTLGSTSGANGLNQNSQTFVAWAWDAGSSSVTNNSGSIASTVRANAQDGVSIVSANYTSGTQSYGHGLGVKPAMYIVKNRNASQNWQIWHKSLSNETTAYLQFNTSGEQTVSNMWSPSTTTTISLATGPVSAGDNFIAYVFAEVEGFSKFGSYTGNGSADGPFVWCGFRPRWVMVKRTDAGGNNWRIWDTARATLNVGLPVLYPNTSDVEDSVTDTYDILCNGFKIRGSGAGSNASSATYIFAAFAESPFKYARAR